MNDQTTVLVTDADPRQRETICRALEGKGLEVLVTDNMYAALDRIERLKIDILIAPLKGDRIDGLKLLEAAYHQNPDVGVVFVTEPNVLETDIGIKATLHHEASFFLPKPLNPAHLNAFLYKILENQRLTLENRQLQSQIDEKVGLIQLTGHSPKIQEIRQIIAQIAPTKATVIIRGERGTGKELVARAMHHRSLRQGQLVVFNCAALTESLAESELFGHERGAFTGAYQRRKGRFEAAHGGTLFLDEIGELSPSNQARLLRVLAEKEFERVGGNETIQVDVRVVCATNRDLEEGVEGGKFMADLYDRLNVIQITLPPLRERKEDIPLLVKVFIEEFSRENRKAVKEMTRRASRALVKYDWPGNVRELRNCIEGMVVMSNRTELDLEDLSEHILQLAGVSPLLSLNVEIGMSLAELEKEAIRATLKYAGNNKAKTAKILGISKRTIFRKIADATSDEKVGLIQLTGHSPKIQEIRQIIAQVAPTKATVIIRGERGTGKELVARAMHHRSLRQGQLVVFNCAALTESLAESELFGHERGAFTGAYQRRKGRFEAAHGGTLFLDEIGELSPSNQARLLRVLAEKEFERIGGNETIQVDVRVICATNRDLEEGVEGGKFMADLYDRLNAIQITLPPLRERKKDIPLLVKVFIEEFSRENRKAVKEMTRRASRALVKYDWPGNVRELRNCIEGMVVMSNRTELDLEDLSEHILSIFYS